MKEKHDRNLPQDMMEEKTVILTAKKGNTSLLPNF
jgi:hypothetical protein